MTIESILVLLVIGAIAGWLAGKLIKGGGFGIAGNIVVGIIGAIIGQFVFGLLGVSAGGTSRHDRYGNHRCGDPAVHRGACQEID